MSRVTVLRATQLEDRAVPAGLTFLFDYRFDDLGFFTNNPDRIAVLEAAGRDLAARFSDTLSAIPFPAPGNSWKAQFQRPSGFGQDEELINPVIPANAVLVFVGASDVGVNEFFEVSSSREVFGDAAWNELVLGRASRTSSARPPPTSARGAGRSRSRRSPTGTSGSTRPATRTRSTSSWPPRRR